MYPEILPLPFGRGAQTAPGGEDLEKTQARKSFIRQNALTLTLSQRERGPYSHFSDRYSLTTDN
jgi:hypothetical protein